MDTAQKFLKTSAILIAATLLLATVGFAQIPTLVAPSTVTIGGTGFNTASVTSSVAGTEINYTIAITYPNGNPSGRNWLVVDPSGTTTTPTPSMRFGLSGNSAAGLTNGVSAKVTLTPTGPAGVSTTPVPITVTFDASGGGGGGGGGGGTISASATTVNLTAAANGQASTIVNITTTSVSAVTINLTTSVSVGNWLSVSPISSTTSSSGASTLTITANASNLTSGFTYQGTVTVTASTGAQVDIAVNFAVGAIVGNGVWNVSPSTILWNFTPLSAVYASQAITVTTTSSSPFYNVATTSTNGWLLAYSPSNTGSAAISGIGVSTPFGLKIGSQVNLLPEGTYYGTAYVYDANNPTVIQITVGVTLNVTSASATVITVSPNPVSFTVALNGAQQNQTVNVTGGAGGFLSVSGSLPAGLTYQLPSNTTVAPGGSVAFTVYANPSGLAANTYGGTLNVVVGSQSSTVDVTMVVGGGGTGTTAVAPTALRFFYQLGTDPTTFVSRPNLVITGPAGPWSSSVATSNGGADWLRLTPRNGDSLPNPADSPIVLIDATGLIAGTYNGTITITTSGGTQKVSVTLIVGAGTVLLPTPGDLVFTALTGRGNPDPQTVYFSGSDGALRPLAIGAVSNNSWITVTNDDRSMTVQVDQTGLTTGVYSGSVSVSQTGAANNPATIPILLVVNLGGTGGTPPPNSNVTVSPTSLTFSAQSGSSPAAKTISVNSAAGSAGVSFTVQVTAGANWLSTSAGASNTTPLTNLTVAVTSSTLAAGSYTGNILITPTGGSPVNVPVYLSIAAAPAGVVSAAPTTFTFDYSAGGATPAPKQLTVSGGGANLAFSATPSTSWLVVSPASGTTTAAGTTVNVSINPAGLSAGSYNGTILVAGAGGASGSTTVSVILNVTTPLPTLPTISRVTNAASFATGSIAPGEIITLFANDPTHPIGPATAVAFPVLDSTGKVATTLGGVQVLINGFACPMIYASASQVSAVVPYEIKRFVSATVLVKFLGQTSNGVLVNVATTVPGVFTQGPGTGPGAILNSDNSTNGPANPATRGDTVVVYLTGEGETSPAGITGNVTTVDLTPNHPLTPAPLLPVSVTIGGQGTQWSFAGEAPTFVSGVMQLNVTVPTNIAAGDQFIVVTIGGNQSQQGVTVSVK